MGSFLHMSSSVVRTGVEYTSVVCVCTVYVPSRPVAKREIGIERLDYQRKTRVRGEVSLVRSHSVMAVRS